MDEKLKKRKSSIISYMETLVGKRLVKETLEFLLSELFGTPITLCEMTNDWDADYRVSFDVEDKDFGYISFDIWYLKTRKEERMYITEVGYDFDCVGSEF